MREYIRFRLKRGGCARSLFTSMAVSRIYRRSRGVPRLVNVLCDRALLGAYAKGRNRVNSSIVGAAARELRGNVPSRWLKLAGWTAGILLLLLAPVAAYTFGWLPERVDREIRAIAPSWLPRVGTEDFTKTSGSLASWIATPALAADPKLAKQFDLDVDEPPVRLGLQGAREAPVNLSGLVLLHADDMMALLSQTGREHVSRVAAMRELADAWSVPTSLVFDCPGVGEFGLSCKTETGGWRRLSLLDRPAVVELGDGQEESGFVLLRYLVGRTVVLRLQGVDYAMPEDEFRQLWRRSGLLFWRSPPLARVPVDDRSNEEDVLWLRRALNLEAANYGAVTLTRVERALFDSELIELLHAFQRRHALDVRDFAGEEELIVLNSRLEYEAHPKLLY
ncbi:MAG: hypothetical protein DWQ08_08355 [Proteobacteria bacterium]|nr:MAG: hypothetical protein DWQ08_08355 [Pseudomonadota bacterium]